MRRARPALWDELNMDDGIQLASRDRYYWEHRQRLHRTRPSINMDSPRNFPKLQSNKMGTFTHSEFEEIARNNKRILERLTNISYQKTRFAKIKAPKTGNKNSLNKSKQRQSLRRIDRENRFLVSRIMNCKPTINHRKINKDWERHKNIIKNRRISKQKRKQFRPNKLSLMSSNVSSLSSTPRTHSHSQRDTPHKSEMSPNTLQKIIISNSSHSQSPLTAITESTNTNTNESELSNFLFKNHNFESQLLQPSKRNKNYSTNIIFTPQVTQVQSSVNMDSEDRKEESEERKQENEETTEEVLSDWEYDEEWMRKEMKMAKNGRKRAHKTVMIGLPLI